MSSWCTRRTDEWWKSKELTLRSDLRVRIHRTCPLDKLSKIEASLRFCYASSKCEALLQDWMSIVLGVIRDEEQIATADRFTSFGSCMTKNGSKAARRTPGRSTCLADLTIRWFWKFVYCLTVSCSIACLHAEDIRYFENFDSRCWSIAAETGWNDCVRKTLTQRMQLGRLRWLGHELWWTPEIV